MPYDKDGIWQNTLSTSDYGDPSKQWGQPGYLGKFGQGGSAGFDSPESRALQERLKQDQLHSLWGQGNRFGDWARGQIGNTLPMATVNHQALDADRQMAAQSYEQQKQALGMMQAQAMGQGPSVAALQGQSGQDAAVAQMMQQGRGGLMQNYGTQAASDAAMARGQEVGQAQQAWAGGAANLRAGSLQDRQQALENAYRASQLNLGQQGQDLERRLKLEQLGLGGYQATQGYLNDLASAVLGQRGVELQNSAQNTAAMTGMFSGFGSGMANYGMSLGKREKEGG